MSSGFILASLGIAAVGFTGRYLLKNKHLIEKAAAAIPTEALSKYHQGGFDPKMSRREASLILGVSFNAKPNKVKEAHKKLMIINHPDRGGSPYIAAKINEAKDYLESNKS
ncbi:unnamed protein product [Bursaphelenchus okinawaensis]|uniref:DnaJ homolog subfamily C member 21 n=1 Tax=Bursaphelenchus okinawaensis TaxID=465554 RepID=A0A811KXP7_9BILA|nr:unnamed protein product [Bursaphelenchus okinawaensis]CAG9113946.1 unnamed protein product [Bursaphelenchus okinawaensis]